MTVTAEADEVRRRARRFALRLVWVVLGLVAFSAAYIAVYARLHREEPPPAAPGD